MENNNHILKKFADGLKNLQYKGLNVDYKEAELTLAIGTRKITFNEDGEVIGESGVAYSTGEAGA